LRSLALARYNESDVMSPARISRLALLGLACALQACSTSPDLTVQHARLEQNKALVRGYLEELSNKGNLPVAQGFFAADLVFNNSRDLRPLLERQRAIRAAFPDHRVVVEDQIAEGDKVVTRVSFSGTHLGDFNGIAATGRRVVYSGTAVDRIVDGKVVEMWHIANTLSLLQQIGAQITNKERVAP
jgi:predicted ester cyclase